MLLASQSLITDLVGVGSFGIAASSFLKQSLARNPRALFLNVAVVLWSSRLASYLFTRVNKLGEDKRLRPFFPQEGEGVLDSSRSNFPLNLAAFWGIQAAWGLITLIPLVLVNSVPSVALSPVSIALAALSLASLGVEAVADWQKSQYRADARNSGHWCDTGLWKLARHPNYFGELSFWWLTFFFSYPALRHSSPLVALALASPVCVSSLVLFVSGVPLLEKLNREKYSNNAEYEEYLRRSRLLAPVPRPK